MPEVLVVCPSCGKEVPEGKFCNICGELLPPLQDDIGSRSEDVTSTQNHDMISTEDKAPLEPLSLPHFDVVIEDMPYEAAVILLSSSELVEIDKELDRIIEQTKATRQALQLQQADRTVLTARAETLRQQFEKTRERRRELISVKDRLVLEKILEALDKQEARLSKLDEIAGTLDKEVYQEQRVEILHAIKDLRMNLKEATKSGTKWSKGIKTTLKKLGKELNRLDAKFKIGDVSREKYEESTSRLERSVRIVEGGLKRLDESLSIARKR
ncbi:MAG: hypothetical protein JW779_08390 [Candidatus Thorarchaeota archaeon]|nr:hypothetical protein [Candidatus Thorarchaeota archaeon]